jgi:hypothetical protein
MGIRDKINCRVSVAKADMKEATNFGGLWGVILSYLEGAPCDRPANNYRIEPNRPPLAFSQAGNPATKAWLVEYQRDLTQVAYTLVINLQQKLGLLADLTAAPLRKWRIAQGHVFSSS